MPPSKRQPRERLDMRIRKDVDALIMRAAYKRHLTHSAWVWDAIVQQLRREGFTIEEMESPDAAAGPEVKRRGRPRKKVPPPPPKDSEENGPDKKDSPP